MKDKLIKEIVEAYKIKIRPLLGLSLLYKTAAWVIVCVLILSATVALAKDSGLRSELIEGNLAPLFSRDYFKDLFFTPLWIVAGFLFNLARKTEYDLIRKQRFELMAFLKGKKEKVEVIEVLDFLHNGYDPDKEYWNRKKQQRDVIKQSGEIQPSDLKI